jgi:hypothetical protein
MLSPVMRGLDPGLDPRIHLLAKRWIAGSSPAMTTLKLARVSPGTRIIV